MRYLSWLAVSAALFAGGCKSPCGGGACSPFGGTLFYTPAARFFGTEKTVYQSDACENVECTSSGYLTLAKYWPSLDGWATKMTAKKCAKKELLRQQWTTKTYLPLDYKRGYTDAFLDVANGESGDVPAVPPPRYWNTAYRSAKGRLAADRWFDGYRAGAADARIKLCSLRQIAASHDWMADGRDGDFDSESSTGAYATPTTPAPSMIPTPPQVPLSYSPRPQPFQPPQQVQLIQQPLPQQVPLIQQPLPQQPVPVPQQQPVPTQPPPGTYQSPPAAYQSPPVRDPMPVQPPRQSAPDPGAVQPAPRSAFPPVPAPSPAPSSLPRTSSGIGPGYAAPTAETPSQVPGGPAAGPPGGAAGPVAVPSHSPSTLFESPRYATPTGTSPVDALSMPSGNQSSGPPPGIFNDPPVWRPRSGRSPLPGHSPLPQQ